MSYMPERYYLRHMSNGGVESTSCPDIAKRRGIDTEYIRSDVMDALIAVAEGMEKSLIEMLEFYSGGKAPDAARKALAAFEAWKGKIEGDK